MWVRELSHRLCGYTLVAYLAPMLCSNKCLTNLDCPRRVIINRLSLQFICFDTKSGHVQQECAYGPKITAAKLRSNYAVTNDTSYLAPTGELWVFRELFKEKWPRYAESPLFKHVISIIARGVCLAVVESSHLNECLVSLLF